MTSRPLGSWLAPPRFILFAVLAMIAVPAGIAMAGWAIGAMAGFDVAAIAFLLSCVPLIRTATPQSMRAATRENDANRAGLLVIGGLISLAVLAAVAAELGGGVRPVPPVLALVVVTLVLAWLFGNMLYALHYAHLYYGTDDGGKDIGGLQFPDTPEPVYWDFVYFAFTLGMTFQTSDVTIASVRLRRVATLHSLAAFVYNLGVIAFTINLLGNG